MGILKSSVLLTVLTLLVFSSFSQKQLQKSKGYFFNPDTCITTKHKIKIKGQLIRYTATVGLFPVVDADGAAIAGLSYTYYKRTNGVDDSRRPIVFMFGGGPGGASQTMHLGGLGGPVIGNLDDKGYPLQPYGWRDNEDCILDAVDIVYVDPVKTGLSRVCGTINHKDHRFFSQEGDVVYLSKWISTFIGRNNRWLSPKFLLGVSYGGIRVAEMSWELQHSHNIFLNGIIMVSPADLAPWLRRFNDINKQFDANGKLRDVQPGDTISIFGIEEYLQLPTMTAVLWYHHGLDRRYQEMPLNKLISEVEEFTLRLISQIHSGAFANTILYKKTCSQLRAYVGVDSAGSNCDYLTLIRDAIERSPILSKMDIGGNNANYTHSLDQYSTGHALVPSLYAYYSNSLRFHTEEGYRTYGVDTNWHFERTDESMSELEANKLRPQSVRLFNAMRNNPFMKIMYQTGYFDRNTFYLINKMHAREFLSDTLLRNRVTFKEYEAGHTVWLLKPARAKVNKDLRDFIIGAIPDEKKAAAYVAH